MRFCCEVDDAIWLKIVNHGLHQSGIGDVPFHKLISRIIRYRDQIIQIPSIGQYIKVEDMVIGFSDLLEDEIAAYKSSTACNYYLFQLCPQIFFLLSY